MHIRCWPLVCMRSVCSNEPSTTSVLPPIRFCSAAVPDAKAVESTVSPSWSKYLRFNATKYATLFIWLIEPPTESAMRGFSSFGAWAAAGVATNRLATASHARRVILFPPAYSCCGELGSPGKALQAIAARVSVGDGVHPRADFGF